MFNGKIDYKWLFSIAMLVYQRVAVVEDHRQEKLLFFICTVRRIGFSQFPDSNPLHFVPAEKILCSGCGGWNGGTPKSSVLTGFSFGKPSMLGYSHVIMTSRTPPCHRREVTFVVLLLMSFREISDDLCQSQKQGWPRRQIFFFLNIFWNISIWSLAVCFMKQVGHGHSNFCWNKERRKMKAEIKSMKSDNPEVLSEDGLYPFDILQNGRCLRRYRSSIWAIGPIDIYNHLYVPSILMAIFNGESMIWTWSEFNGFRAVFRSKSPRPSLRNSMLWPNRAIRICMYYIRYII